MKRYSLMYQPPTMANDDCGDYVLYREAKAEIDELASAAIDFIDQMRVQGCDIHMLPAEYDTLVDVVNKYRGK